MAETPSPCRQSSASGGEIEPLLPKWPPEAAEPIPKDLPEPWMDLWAAAVAAAGARPIRCDPSIPLAPPRFDGSNWCWRMGGRRVRAADADAGTCSDGRRHPDSDGSIGIERKYPDGDDSDCAGAPHPTRPPDPVGNSNC